MLSSTRERGGGVQDFSVEAASFESATRLFSALAQFEPELTTDEQGRFFVSVELGGDTRVVKILDTIQKHLAERKEDDPVSCVAVALDDRRYTVHDR
jgi:hypothetical protein